MAEKRGGPRVPDGIPRPANIPFAQGPNRQDLAALPGTPGTPLPPNPVEPQVSHGQAGKIRRTLSDIPLQSLQPGQPLTGPTQAPNEPITSGISAGAGAGPESVIQSPVDMSNKLAASNIRYAYPILMKLATMPDATPQTKLLVQRIRSQLAVQPEQMPRFPGE